MRFCGMNVYFDTRQASADSYLITSRCSFEICQLLSDILSIYILYVLMDNIDNIDYTHDTLFCM